MLPADPATKQYIRMCMDPIVGFPPLVRSSWATAKILLEERGVKFVWWVWCKIDKIDSLYFTELITTC